MILEICASNYQSAINAQESGAHRIELCQKLSVGGLTPNNNLLKRTLDSLSIPVFVLIRPRSGNFVYSEVEFDMIKQSIQSSKNLGAKGIVSGVLNSGNTIDIKRTKELVELSRPLSFTFHRAFDEVYNPMDALDQLIELGIERVLTSGQKSSAKKGIELLKALKKKAENKITILPGAGIDPSSINLFKNSGFTEIHASATGNGIISNAETIKELLKIINE